MAKTSPVRVDEKRGDAILKRMLQAKPKPHKEIAGSKKTGKVTREK